ncbi:conjugal transfer protein TraF [Candidatus Woesearchaeota archaeon]|nr:conjugal transfer protein TraF [Candidatus Woesearchaeota archaeon]
MTVPPHVDRHISKSRYIIAFIITVLAFTLGVSLGFILDDARIKSVENQNREQELNYNGLQLQYLYLNRIGNTTDVCPTLRVALENSIEELSESLDAVQRYEKDTTLNKDEYRFILRKYLQDNLRYWIFSQNIRVTCNDDVVNILYFFSNEKCDVCPNQGKILTHFKKKLHDKLLIFPINVDLEEDENFIKILKARYNVTSLPTIVVNDIPHQGVVGQSELSVIICQETNNKETCLIS